MINTPSKANGKSLDIYSTFTYGDARIELEIMVPKGIQLRHLPARRI